MAASTLFKPTISMADACLTISLLPSKPHFLSLPSSSSSSNPRLPTSLSLSKRPPFVPLVARTELGQEGFDWDGEAKSLEGDAQLSDWEGVGEASDVGGAVALAEPEGGLEEEEEEEERVMWSRRRRRSSSWGTFLTTSTARGSLRSLRRPAWSRSPSKVFIGGIGRLCFERLLPSIQDVAFKASFVIYNRETDQSRGFGFVTMSMIEEAEKAVEMFNRYDVNGRLLTVNKAAPRGSQPERIPRSFEPSFRLYVGNLPWQVDDARLEQVFSEHGKVVEARVVYDRETGRSRGFGFVTMASETELDDAIAALDGQNLDGRAIRVNVAEERPRRNSF
ncbi:hypothetical protein QJS10_CPA06g01245 [Acorus calamus]|uniref:RRM domain-containing protein n=1 Tax=Acorus calamus TaxID=4465 RepID=A0AAV9ELN9_ACOCL|nr:hypothetical protein QJS10_CPA06g01245 [Acorus calamus]